MESFYNFVNAYHDFGTGVLWLPIEIGQKDKYLLGDQVFIEVVAKEALLLGISVTKAEQRSINSYGGERRRIEERGGIRSVVVPGRLAIPFIENNNSIKKFEVWISDDLSIIYYPVHSGRFAARPHDMAYSYMNAKLQDYLGDEYGRKL